MEFEKEEDMAKKEKKSEVTRIFNIINDNDGNNSFYVEAKTSEEAAFKSLEVLGWSVYGGEPGRLDEDGEPIED